MTKLELYALNSIKGIGPKAVFAFIKFLESLTITTIKDLDISTLDKDKNLSRYKKVLQNNLPWHIFERYIEKAHEAIQDIENRGIDIVSIFDEEYPKLLKITNDAPLFLYCKGNKALLQNINNIAVVGTRKNTDHGKLITQLSHIKSN